MIRCELYKLKILPVTAVSKTEICANMGNFFIILIAYTMIRNSHQRSSMKKLFLKSLQYSQEDTCVRVSS